MAEAPEVNHVHYAEVVRVIDGDTFIARVDLDFRCRVDVTVRVRGRWAGEMNTAEGQQEKLALESRLRAVDNQIVMLSYKDTMSFSRWVCDVWIDGEHLTDAPPLLKLLE